MDAGGTISPSNLVDDMNSSYCTHSNMLVNTNAAECMKQHLSDCVEFIADLHTINKVKVTNFILIQPHTNENQIQAPLHMGLVLKLKKTNLILHFPSKRLQDSFDFLKTVFQTNIIVLTMVIVVMITMILVIIGIKMLIMIKIIIIIIIIIMITMRMSIIILIVIMIMMMIIMMIIIITIMVILLLKIIMIMIIMILIIIIVIMIIIIMIIIIMIIMIIIIIIVIMIMIIMIIIVIMIMIIIIMMIIIIIIKIIIIKIIIIIMIIIIIIMIMLIIIILSLILQSNLKGGTQNLNEDTLGGQLKSGIAQYVALEFTRGNGRENRAITRYLPWLYHPPSAMQQG